jgi:transcriptional regulator with XRE-family HTH domain
MNEIAKSIRSKRESLGLTQEETALKLNITQSQIARFENGTKIPSLLTTIQMAEVFRCSIDELIGRRAG